MVCDGIFMQRNIFVIWIIFLFIFSAITPMVIGYKISKSTEELIVEKELQPAEISDGGLMESAWPMFQHDVRHTGRSQYGKSGNWFVEKWHTDIGSLVYSSPAIDKNGTIYIGSNNWYFYAIYSNGTKKWRFKTGGGVSSSPAIAEDGTIYVGSEDGKLYAVYPNGTKKWSQQVGNGWVYTSPVIDENGIIYATSVIGSNICAFYPNGTKKWDTTLGGWIYCRSPGLDNNGIVYCGANDGRMYAIYKNNGTIKWKYKTGEGIGSAPTISDDGTIYFGSNDGYLYALYPNRTLKWRFLTREFFGLTSSPAIAEDGSIIIGSGFDYIYSINPDNGTENWRFNAGADVSASPAIDKYGVIYVGAWNGMFYALNPDGTLQWKYKALDRIFPSAAIAEDGTIYFGSHSETFNAYLYAIEPFENNPPDKPSINGTVNGKLRREYTYTALTKDSDGDNVSYFFDWGDGTTSGWTEFIYSGFTMSRSHTWQRRGNYTVRVKAKDIYGMQGDWSELVVTMPRNKIVFNSFVFQIIEKLFVKINFLLN